MKVLLDGTLDQNLQLKDLFSGISQAEAPGLTVLKFAVSKQEFGELYFLGGHYIVCARLSQGSVAGKPALSALLQLKEADFVYYACDSVDALPHDDNLKIEVKELIAGWQEVNSIPEDQLLDKIFNVPLPVENTQAQAGLSASDKTTAIVKEEEEPVQSAPRDKSLLNADQSAPSVQAVQSMTKTGLHAVPRDDVDWSMVEPLISDGAPRADAGNFEDEADGQSYTAAHGVRTLSHGSQWQHGVRRLLLFLIVLLIGSFTIVCTFWMFVNAPSAHFEPRRYAVPMQRRGLQRTP